VSDARRDTAGVVAPPPLIFGGALIAGLALDALAPSPFAPRAARLLGWPLVATGAATGIAGFRALRRAGTEVDPRRPTTRIVDDGPYARSRNPLYVAMALVYGGVTLRADAGWAALLLPGALLVIGRGVIDREERYLEARFGDEYRAYRERVPRWA
jgi:protein-S-isoprenylcysteine O-methyltransferase Ste14